MDDDFLLRLYRLARECDAGRFPLAAIQLLKRTLDFESAFWGEGHLLPGATGAILKSGFVDEIDPAFLAEWQLSNYQDRVIPMVVANPGRSIEVQVPSFYSAEPEWAALGEKYRMRSFAVTSQIASDGVECRWLSLYRPDAHASGARRDLGWLEFVMPHLCEAWQIHRIIHPTPEQQSRSSAEYLAVAEVTTGQLLSGEPGFLDAVVTEWSAFDGARLPSPLRKLWTGEPCFVHHGRTVVISGSCAGDLVMLTAQPRTNPPRLTQRQREIAAVYAQGWSHKEIAAGVKLSPATVRNHLASVYQALGVHSRRELAHALARPDVTSDLGA